MRRGGCTHSVFLGRFWSASRLWARMSNSIRVLANLELLSCGCGPVRTSMTLYERPGMNPSARLRALRHRVDAYAFAHTLVVRLCQCAHVELVLHLESLEHLFERLSGELVDRHDVFPSSLFPLHCLHYHRCTSMYTLLQTFLQVSYFCRRGLQKKAIWSASVAKLMVPRTVAMMMAVIFGLLGFPVSLMR